MAHAQKPDFVFQRNGRVHLNRRGRQFSLLPATEVCGISGSNAGYTVFRGSVKGTGYPLHSPVSPSLPLPCVTVCHHISTGVYYTTGRLLSHYDSWLNGNKKPSRKGKKKLFISPPLVLRHFVLRRFILTAVASLHHF